MRTWAQEHASKAHPRQDVTFRTKHTDDDYVATWCTKCGEQTRRKKDTSPRLVAEGEA